MKVEFRNSPCIIQRSSRAIAKGKKIGKAYVLDCEQEEALLVEYAKVVLIGSFGMLA